MRARNNELKSLATLAKQRMKQGKYTEGSPVPGTKAPRQLNTYFVKNWNTLKKLSGHVKFVTIDGGDSPEFVKKVCSILEQECFNPIGKLVDKDHYSKLSEAERQFYVLNLCEKYNRIKDDYLKQKIG